MRVLPLVAALVVSFSAFAATPTQPDQHVLSGEAAAATLETFTGENGVVAVLSKHYLSLAVAGAGPNAIRQKSDADYVSPAEMAFFHVGARAAYLLYSAQTAAYAFQQENTFWRRLMSSLFDDSKLQDVNQSFTNQNRVKTCNSQLVAANKQFQAHYVAFQKRYPESPLVDSFSELALTLKTVAAAAAAKPTEFPIPIDENVIYKTKYSVDKVFNTGISLSTPLRKAGSAEHLIVLYGLTSFEKYHGVSHAAMYKEDTRDLSVDPAGACAPPMYTVAQRAIFGREFSNRRDEIGDYLRKTGEIKN